LTGQILAVNGGSSVYGGSQPFPPASLEPLPLDLPLRLEVVGSNAGTWQALASAPTDQPAYAGCLDLSPLSCAPGSLLQAVHAAAARFAARHTQLASLTVLLPSRQAARWQDAGDIAAARMLVSTLACEWGGRALRINALEVPQDMGPASLHPLLRYVCGAAAQFLTGQTLVCQGSNTKETR
jgi:hypothetical protein